MDVAIVICSGERVCVFIRSAGAFYVITRESEPTAAAATTAAVAVSLLSYLKIKKTRRRRRFAFVVVVAAHTRDSALYGKKWGNSCPGFAFLRRRCAAPKSFPRASISSRSPGNKKFLFIGLIFLYLYLSFLTSVPALLRRVLSYYKYYISPESVVRLVFFFSRDPERVVAQQPPSLSAPRYTQNAQVRSGGNEFYPRILERSERPSAGRKMRHPPQKNITTTRIFSIFLMLTTKHLPLYVWSDCLNAALFGVYRVTSRPCFLCFYELLFP